MRRLLVTGGAGFIGSNFVHYWLDNHAGTRLVVLDALTYAGNVMNLTAARDRTEFRLVVGSICDTALVERLLIEERLDTIVHFAAESHVDRSILGPDAFIEANIIGTHSLLKAARKVWLEQGQRDEHRFHHVSTDEVYGSLGPVDPPFKISTPYAPNSPYSASKAASDHLVRAYHHTYGLSITTTNCSNNYGPYQFPEKLIPLMIVNILEGKPLPIYGDGRNIRDWLHVDDHCRGIDMVLSAGKPGHVYNIGGRAEKENIELVRILCAIADEMFAANPALKERFRNAGPATLGSASELIRFVTDRPGHDRRYAIDSAEIEEQVGFTPRVSLQDGLRSTFQWFLDNEAWWRAILSGSYEALKRSYSVHQQVTYG